MIGTYSWKSVLWFPQFPILQLLLVWWYKHHMKIKFNCNAICRFMRQIVVKFPTFDWNAQWRVTTNLYLLNIQDVFVSLVTIVEFYCETGEIQLFLHPNEHLQRIFWYLVKQLRSEVSDNEHFQVLKDSYFWSQILRQKID